jgi:hypothetical protein
MLFGVQDVDARDKRGHDESITHGRWYDSPLMERRGGPETTKRLSATWQTNALIEQERRRTIVSRFTSIRYLHFAMHIWAGKLQ